MKKMLKLILVGCLAASLMLAGCSKNEKSSSSAASSEASSSSSVASSSQSVSLTPAEANDRIDEDSINLIQFDEPEIGDTIATIKTSYGVFFLE